MNSTGKTAGDEFDALWSADEQQGAPAQTAAPAATGATQDAEPSLGDEGQQPAPTGEAASNGEAADEAGEAGAQAAAGEGGDAGAQDEADAWIAELPEEVQARVRAIREEEAAARAAAEKAQRQFEAAQGRVAPLQQQLARLQSAKLQEGAGAAPNQPQAAATAAGSSHSIPEFDSEDWKKWERDFPAEAKVVRGAIEATRQQSAEQIASLRQQLDASNARFQRMDQFFAETEVNRGVAELSAAHPDWEEHNNSPEFWDWFDDYRAKQPRVLRDSFYNPETLDAMFRDPEFLIDTLNRYKGANGSGAATSAQQGAPANTQQGEQVPAQQTQQRVSTRMRMGAAPSQRGERQPTAAARRLDDLPPGDQFEAIWNNTTQ